MSVLQEQLKKFEDGLTGGKGFEEYFSILLRAGAINDDDITCWVERAFKEGWDSRYNTLTYHDL